MLRKMLLGCGAVTVAFYAGMDILAALRHEGYSYTGQTISELSAIDAPTRSMWIPLGVVYSLLTIAGGAGIWMATGRRRRLRAVAVMQVAIGVIGLVAWPFAPMHQREVLAAGGGTFSDTMHIVLATVDSLLFMAAMPLGMTALGRRFRRFSPLALVVVFVSGMLTGMEGARIAANEPTPWVGVTERIAVFGSMLWASVLCAGLLLAERAPRHLPRLARPHSQPAAR